MEQLEAIRLALAALRERLRGKKTVIVALAGALAAVFASGDPQVVELVKNNTAEAIVALAALYSAVMTIMRIITKGPIGKSTPPAPKPEEDDVDPAS